MGASMETVEDTPIQRADRNRKLAEQAELLEFALDEATSEWFYDFELEGEQVEGIGLNGAMELAAFRAQQGYPIRLLNGIDLVEVERNKTLGVQATVVAREARTSREGVGTAFFPHFINVDAKGEIVELRAGQPVEIRRQHDPRADRKALSVAKRNAILDLIPDEVIRTLLDERTRVVPLNEARKQAEAIAYRQQHAPAVRTVVPGEREPGPYDTPPTQRRPTPAAPPPATTRQIVQLAQLIAHPSVSEPVRNTVKARLESGLSEFVAGAWISVLEVEVKAPA